MSKVYLVGAGPGDPDLITCKGRKLLAIADAVLYDHLANDALLDLTPQHCEHVYVGKKKAAHAFTQEEICGMLIERARRGQTVVRLKGGDPYLFGRGGEEAEALQAAGVAFEVIPGVTAALGIAAYSGVPLTHREHTSAVTFVTGHDPSAIDWDRIGHSETLVVMMGLTTIGEIARQMIARGRRPDTPAIAVRWATRPHQQTIAGTLADIACRIDVSGMKPPATIIIGEVVALHERLNWYERLPLFGKRIVVTRAQDQAGEFAEALRNLGADAVEIPSIALEPPRDPEPLDRAISHLSGYDWLIFTSTNGVRFFMERLDRSPHDLRSLRARICAIGPATRRAIEAMHIKVDLMPEQYVAEGVLRAFGGQDLSHKRILLPRAAVARDLIPVELEKRGATVDVVETYRNVVPENTRAQWEQLWSSGRKPDWITFTSSSTVKNFLEMTGLEALSGIKIASIGPVTSGTLSRYGLKADAEAKEYTIQGLIEALLSAIHA